jgi:carbamoyltransferase
MSMEEIIIGLNLSHNSSCSIHKIDGILISALEEERLTRRKNESSFPINSIKKLLSDKSLGSNIKVSKIVIGSHRDPNDQKLSKWYQLFNPSASVNTENQKNKIIPGELNSFKNVTQKYTDSRTYVEDQIWLAVEELGVEKKSFKLDWVAHHDAHSASGAIGAPWHSQFAERLSFSLDGVGDNESGVVQIFTSSGHVRDLVRIPHTQSYGLAYSEVTKRYGFKSNRHEGKITGLAGFGEYSAAVEYLLNCIKASDGKPDILVVRNKFNWLINRVNAKARGIKFKIPTSLENMIDVATSLSPKYADLAFAIQFVIEERITEIVKYWVRTTGIREVTLSGGVFSNVKVNQRIAELDELSRVFVFPNMGDGGLSAGGVWRSLFDQGSLSKKPMFDNMFLGPNSSLSRVLSSEDVKKQEFSDLTALHRRVAELLNKGYIVGSCIGRMEFGPRALCNRSILAAPFDSKINEVLNARLERTEFMPFAPVILPEFINEVFELNKHKSLVPFDYMTMTCRVKAKWQTKIPAVVHIDGTARPQIINQSSSPTIYSILTEFFKLTGSPVLINTSFNTHEEPIIENLDQALSAMKKNKVDFIFDETSIYTSKNI